MASKRRRTISSLQDKPLSVSPNPLSPTRRIPSLQEVPKVPSEPIRQDNIRTTAQVDGHTISPTGAVSLAAPRPPLAAPAPPISLDTDLLPPPPADLSKKHKADAAEAQSFKVKEWRPILKVDERNNVVQEKDRARDKGLSLALTRGLNLPADRESNKRMNPLDRWDSIHQHLVEGLQQTSAAMEDYYTVIRSHSRQHELFKKYQEDVEGQGSMKEALDKAQEEIARLGKAHSAKIAELEIKLRVQKEDYERKLKQSLDTATANAIANLRKAVAREAEIRKDAEAQIKKVEEEARERVSRAEEATRKANKEKELLLLKLREKATLAEEATRKAIKEKESLGQILMKRGAKGLTAADIDTLLLGEWELGVFEAQAKDRVDLPDSR